MLHDGVKINLWLGVFLLSSVLLFGQNITPPYYGGIIKHKKLKTVDKDLDGQIYLSNQILDSIGNIRVYLVNHTNTDLYVPGDNRSLDFEMEAINQGGNWVSITETGDWCGTGIGPYTLPKHTFTWGAYSTYRYKGDFETMMRSTIRVKDSIIVSEPVKVKISRDIFLNPYRREFNFIDRQLKNASTPQQKQRLTLKKIKIYIKAHFYLKAFELNKKLLQAYPNYEPAYYTLGGILYKYGLYAPNNLSKVQEIAFYSAAIEQFNKVNQNDKYYSQAQKWISILRSKIQLK